MHMPENSLTQEINKTAGTVLDVLCTECKRETKHAILASVDISGQDYYENTAVDYWASHQVIQCQGCETISFRVISGNSEDFDIVGPNTIDYNESITLFPSRTEGRSPIKDVHLLSVNIQRIYAETIRAMGNDQPVLTGIGIRALVETICKDKQARGKSLAEQIDSLVQLGLLTQEGATILHKIRTLGNSAAHEVKPHKAELLGVAIDVCEHLLQGVYLLPHHAKKAFE
jgi:uncharacterized protein DUF4145